MRDLEDDYTSDYKGRDIKAALEEAKQMVDTILTPLDQTPLAVREEIAHKTSKSSIISKPCIDNLLSGRVRGGAKIGSILQAKGV